MHRQAAGVEPVPRVVLVVLVPLVLVFWLRARAELRVLWARAELRVLWARAELRVLRAKAERQEQQARAERQEQQARAQRQVQQVVHMVFKSSLESGGHYIYMYIIHMC